MAGINVFSGFDGISCGLQALNNLGISVNNYYAAEIDPHAIRISQDNHPNIKRLGDITKWREWDLDWSSIDLVLGGSPCQGFSMSGDMLAFDDPRSVLFFEYADILNHTAARNPNVDFLLENVKMKKDFRDVISKYMNVEPILINSNLVSAQNRPRYYWTSLPTCQPWERKIYLKDILQTHVDEKYLIDHKVYMGFKASEELARRFYFNTDHGRALNCWNPHVITAITERRTAEARAIRAKSIREKGVDFSPRRGKELTFRTDGKANCLTAGFSMKEHTIFDGFCQYRKLTPVEWERLQTLPDNYTRSVSDHQRYKCLGNGWNVATIEHLLQPLKR